jgi:hypothetical protein
MRSKNLILGKGRGGIWLTGDYVSKSLFWPGAEKHRLQNVIFNNTSSIRVAEIHPKISYLLMTQENWRYFKNSAICYDMNGISPSSVCLDILVLLD